MPIQPSSAVKPTCSACGLPIEDMSYIGWNGHNYHNHHVPMHEPPPAWQPIETAPKDGREFLGINARSAAVGYRVVYFDEDATEPYIWHVEDAAEGFNHHRDFLTHWMPLPKPPTTG